MSDLTMIWHSLGVITIFDIMRCDYPHIVNHNDAFLHDIDLGHMWRLEDGSFNIKYLPTCRSKWM